LIPSKLPEVGPNMALTMGYTAIIMREIIKARATCGSFLGAGKTQSAKLRFGVANGLEAS
jgi:hypothetical protein